MLLSLTEITRIISETKFYHIYFRCYAGVYIVGIFYKNYFAPKLNYSAILYYFHFCVCVTGGYIPIRLSSTFLANALCAAIFPLAIMDWKISHRSACLA